MWPVIGVTAVMLFSSLYGCGTDVSVYFLAAEELRPGAARAAATPPVADAALTELLAGPTEAERGIGLATAIPSETRLHGVSVEDRIATVDLSEDFASGGGSLSMQARVAQVVYTATQFHTVDAVLFHIDGEPVRAMGGEGILLDEPVTRSDFEFQGRFDQLVPTILVETPRPFARLTDPVRVAGTANTFEATVNLELVDEQGNVLDQDFVTATSGSGKRGTFEATLSFPGAAAGPASLVTFEVSARDGSRTNVFRTPVTLD